MRKIIVLLLALTCIFTFAGCNKTETYRIAITIPPGNQETFIFADEYIIPTGDKITLACNEDLGAAQRIISPVDESLTAGYVANPLTVEIPVEYDVDKDVLLKIGVSAPHDLDISKTVYIEVSGVEIAIE